MFKTKSLAQIDLERKHRLMRAKNYRLMRKGKVEEAIKQQEVIAKISKQIEQLKK